MNITPIRPPASPALSTDQLLVREATHRFANDMQMVVGLVALESRRSSNPEVKRVLNELRDRISIFAEKRTNFVSNAEHSLAEALQSCCQTLIVQAEARGVLVSFCMDGEDPDLDPDTIRIVSLAVNELATNAMKHAFVHKTGGRIRVKYHHDGGEKLVVTVDDDGAPLPAALGGYEAAGDGHHGLRFAAQLVASIDGRLLAPSGGTKLFKIEVPAKPRVAELGSNPESQNAGPLAADHQTQETTGI